MSQRVLIVDDDPNLLAGLRDRLHGFIEVATAPDGQTGLARVLAEPSIALVISDFRMSGMDGIGFLSELRRVRPEVVRVLMTGNADLAVATQAVNTCGVFKLLFKPSPAGEIESTITTALEHYDDEMRSRSLALEDYLLGIGNRRALELALARVHSHARRWSRHYSVAMIDVDRFKNYNDTCGHLAGDRALQAVVHAIRQTCRASDEVFRYGGEELVLLLSDTGLEGAAVACERFRARVEALEIPHEIDGRRYLTISIGGATYNGCDAVAALDLLQRADRALYRSKAAGRNRVTLWNPDEP